MQLSMNSRLFFSESPEQSRTVIALLLTQTGDISSFHHRGIL